MKNRTYVADVAATVRQPFAGRLAFTIPEAAAVAGVSPDTIRKAIHASEASFLRAKRVGRKIIIPAADLQAWIDSLPDV